MTLISRNIARFQNDFYHSLITLSPIVTLQSLTARALPVQGGTLDTITYYVLSNPEILKRLKAELASAFPHPTNTITYEAARRLPYLSAVISEGLRMAGSVSGRLARSNPTAPIIYGS